MKIIRSLVPDMPKTEELIPWLKEIDKNHWYSNFGPLVQEFEGKLESIMTNLSVDTPMHLCTTSSGTSAIEVAILAHKLPLQSRILIPGLTFPGTINAIIQTECEPIISDIDEGNWCLTPEIARAVFKYQPFDMVMPVATYGYPLDIKAWQTFHNETGIPVLIDAAGAFGCQRPGRGITVVFSMHATKTFGIGEGGCVVSGDELFIQNVREITNFGFSESLINKWGTNAKLSEYHAAVGLAQLERWHAMKERREQIYRQYISRLREIDKEISWQELSPGLFPSVLVINTHADGERISKEMRENGIENRRWYCPPLNRHSAYTKYKTVSRNGYPKLTGVESVSAGLVGLPFHNFLSENDIETVAGFLEGLKF